MDLVPANARTRAQVQRGPGKPVSQVPISVKKNDSQFGALAKSKELVTFCFLFAMLPKRLKPNPLKTQ